MNIRYVIKQLGLIMIILCGSILVMAAYTAFQPEQPGILALEISAAVSLAVAVVLWLIGRGAKDFLGRREALLLVGVSWLAGAALSALPYYFWPLFDTAVAADHPFRSYVDCYFEAMSGLTTTGATVLGDVGSEVSKLPRGLLLWRATTQWLGGVGIVVLFVAVLPTVGVGGKKLFQVEAPGPTATGVRPKIRETARVLWLIYLMMTMTEMLALRICGIEWFDAVCHTFATLAIGGFSTFDASIGDTTFGPAAHFVMIVFMIAAGVNFGLYYHLLRGRFKVLWTDPELRLYLGFLLVASIVVVLSIMHHNLVTTAAPDQPVKATVGQAIRHGIIQTVSIGTTTGFSTADFDQWGFVPKAVLLALMFIGASAGSTGGGIKVIRILVALKVMLAEVERVFHPHIVRMIKVGRTHVDPELRQGTLVYVLGILLLFLIGAVLLMLFEANKGIDFTTAAMASAATLNNIGPGFARVGPMEHYGWFSSASKILMSLLMVLGRLEVYAIFVLFVPRFWKTE